jgi:hypothetical protein
MCLDALRAGSPDDPVVEVYTLDWVISTRSRPGSFASALDLAEAEQAEEAGGLAYLMRVTPRSEARRFLERCCRDAAEGLPRSPAPDESLTVVLITSKGVTVLTRPLGGRSVA